MDRYGAARCAARRAGVVKPSNSRAVGGKRFMTQSTAIVRSDDGYEQAKEAVRDLVCGDCGSALVVLFMKGDGWAAKCPKDQAHPNRISHRQIEQDEIRQRMERNPGVSRELATQNARVPLT